MNSAIKSTRLQRTALWSECCGKVCLCQMSVQWMHLQISFVLGSVWCSIIPTFAPYRTLPLILTIIISGIIITFLFAINFEVVKIFKTIKDLSSANLIFMRNHQLILLSAVNHFVLILSRFFVLYNKTFCDKVVLNDYLKKSCVKSKHKCFCDKLLTHKDLVQQIK